MATYAQLTAQYKALKGYQIRKLFQEAHPNWWKNFQATGGADTRQEPASTPTGAGQGTLDTMPNVPGIQTGSTGGGATPPIVEPPEEVPDDAPPMPTTPLPAGWEWVWNGTQWIPQEGEAGEDPQAVADKAKHDNDLFMLYKDTLEQFGFTGEGLDAFLKQSVKEDWNDSTFVIKMRQQDWYLANPLYAANLARAKAGGQFMAEAQVLAYADAARGLARSFGYQEPSDNYIAQAIQGGMSPAEFEHRLTIQDRIKQFGGGVAMVYEALMGTSATDQDLFEVFDPEISRKDFDDRARAAEMRGRPLLLGLGIRSAEEQRALELLGVTQEQAWQGYQQLANALPSVSRLAAIDQSVANDPTNPFDSFGSLFAAIFEGGEKAVKAREALDALRTREQARFNTRGTPVGAQGQLVGLLGAEERASFG